MKKILALPIFLLSLSSLFGTETQNLTNFNPNEMILYDNNDYKKMKTLKDTSVSSYGVGSSSLTLSESPANNSLQSKVEPQYFVRGSQPLTIQRERTKLEKLKDAVGKVGTNLKNSAFYVPRQVKESYQSLKGKFFLDKNNKLRRDRDYSNYNHNLNRVDVFNHNHNLTKGQRAKVAATKVGLAAAAPLNAAARGAVAAGKGVVDAAKWVKNKIRPAARNRYYNI